MAGVCIEGAFDTMGPVMLTPVKQRKPEFFLGKNSYSLDELSCIRSENVLACQIDLEGSLQSSEASWIPRQRRQTARGLRRRTLSSPVELCLLDSDVDGGCLSHNLVKYDICSFTHKMKLCRADFQSCDDLLFQVRLPIKLFILPLGVA